LIYLSSFLALLVLILLNRAVFYSRFFVCWSLPLRVKQIIVFFKFFILDFTSFAGSCDFFFFRSSWLSPLVLLFTLRSGLFDLLFGLFLWFFLLSRCLLFFAAFLFCRSFRLGFWFLRSCCFFLFSAGGFWFRRRLFNLFFRLLWSFV